MAHFEKRKFKPFPIDENNCCKVCKTKVVEKRHPFKYNMKVYVNLKDSKSHSKPSY